MAQRYGPDRSFEDARLIGEIVSLTHPQVRQFFDHYVTGRRPLPYPEYFAKIGWRLEAPGTVTERGEPLPPAARKLRLGVLGPAG